MNFARHAMLTVLGLLTTVAFGCAQPTKIRIATDAGFPPFHMIDENGRATGYDVELAAAVVTQAGLEPEIVVVDSFSDLFTGLTAGDHDLVAATTGITADRQERFLFTEPYFSTCQAVLVRIGQQEPASIAELAGCWVGASQGTTSVAAARRTQASEVFEVRSASDGVSALLTRNIDAYIADEFEAVARAKANRGLRVLRQPAALERYGFVLARNRPDLKRRLDRALREIEASGFARKLRVRYGLERPADWPVDLSLAIE